MQSDPLLQFSPSSLKPGFIEQEVERNPLAASG